MTYTSDAPRLAARVAKYFAPESVRVIWEVGSRDGRDAVALAHAFSGSVVHAFEPNPETFGSLRECAASTEAVLAHNVALNDTSGSIPFFQIDTSKTVTPWLDGNPGASSLFRPLGTYDHVERYVTREILVPAETGDEIVRAGVAPPPDLIWMDVQGSELRVLQGMPEALASVKALYVELSLNPIYEGQALAYEVIELLADRFLWVGVMNQGFWQFDAIFIDRSQDQVGARVRDALLRRSLQSRWKLGISATPSQVGLHRIAIPATEWTTAKVRRFPEPAKRLVRPLAHTGAQVSQQRLSRLARMTLEASLPADPLCQEPPVVEIDLAVVAHPKDFGTLGLALTAATNCSRNPVAERLVVLPDQADVNAASLPEDVRILRDSDLLDETAAMFIEAAPVARRGWLRQQVLKFLVALNGTRPATLIVDADTVLLKPRTWLAPNGMQLLAVSHERHQPYVDHAHEVWPNLGRQTVSFVTHHQLMQGDVIWTMFPNGRGDVQRWARLADWTKDSSPLSEFHSYGTWLLGSMPARAALAAWANKSVRPIERIDEHSLVELHRRFPNDASLSFHSYL